MDQHLSKDRPQIYQISVQGRLDRDWSDWFGGMTVTYEDGSSLTTLTGAIPDQAALRAILTRIWDVNLTLLSVNRVEREEKQG
jgi:hypothetical protein